MGPLKILVVIFLFRVGVVYSEQVPNEVVEFLISQTRHQDLSQIKKDLRLKQSENNTAKGFEMPDPYRPRVLTQSGKNILGEMVFGAPLRNYQIMGPDSQTVLSDLGLWEQIEKFLEDNSSLVGTRFKKYQLSFYHQPSVHQWFVRRDLEEVVCAARFVSEDGRNHTIKTFPSAEIAINSGYFVTHKNHCGVCSGLNDLGAYLKTRDIATVARKCSKKLGIGKIKKCYQENLFFSSPCAEVWAYNSRNTRKYCKKTCIKEYGLINVILGKFPRDHGGGDDLRPCILCDELRSVAGYNFAAGRTRRNSGVISGIPRNDEDIYDGVDFELLIRKVRSFLH